MVLSRFLPAAFAFVVVLTAGCGSGPEFSELPDNRASGPGFTFELQQDWVAVDDAAELIELVGGDLPPELAGFDLENGIVAGGFWANPEQQETRPRVNVLVEPVTRDTKLQDAQRSATFLLRRSGLASGDIDPVKTQVDGLNALGARYQSADSGLRSLGLSVRRGTFVYSITVQSEGSSEELEELADLVLESWRWSGPSEAEKERLRAIREFESATYSVTLPPGWRATGAEALAEASSEAPANEQQLVAGVDSLWRGHVGKQLSTNAQVRINPAPRGDVEGAVRAVAAEERRIASATPGFALRSIDRGPDFVLDGEPAPSLAIEAAGRDLQVAITEVVTLHEGMIYTITLTTTRDRSGRDGREFSRALRSWNWV